MKVSQNIFISSVALCASVLTSTAEASALSSCRNYWRSLTQTMAPSDYQWVGKPLPETHWQNLISRVHKQLVADNIPVLEVPKWANHLSIRHTEESTTVLVGEHNILTPLTDNPHDTRILNQAVAASKDLHVVGDIRVLTRDKNVIYGKKFRMHKSENETYSAIYDSLNETIHLASDSEQLTEGIHEIIISFANPFYEVWGWKGRAPIPIGVDISETTQKISQQISISADHVRVRSRALSPNGYSYEAVYLDGEAVPLTRIGR